MWDAGGIGKGRCRLIRRSLLNIAAAVLLVLALVTGIEAARGFRRFDRFTLVSRIGTIEFSSNWGEFTGFFGRAKPSVSEQPKMWISRQAWPYLPWETREPWDGLVSTEFDHFGFGYARGWYAYYQPPSGPMQRNKFRLIALPACLAPLLAGLFPAWWYPRQYRQRRTRRRIARGECGHCGYSMSANASGICPECGTPVVKQKVGG
jgi:hypothetical protein